MFTKNSVSQSMIDAVQSVLAEDKKLLLEPGKKKETPPFDGPYKKADTKPGHGDASRVKHLAKMAIPKDVKEEDVSEELKGDQHKLDKNRNGKLDSHDFKLLRMKKEGVLNAIKSGAKKVLDKVAPGDDKLLKDLEKETGGKRPNMYNKPKNEEVELHEESMKKEEVEESADLDEGMSGGSYASFHKETGKIGYIGNKTGMIKHVKSNPDHTRGYTGPNKKVGDIFGGYPKKNVKEEVMDEGQDPLPRETTKDGGSWVKGTKTATHYSGKKTYEYKKFDKEGKETGERHYRDAQGNHMGEAVEELDELSKSTLGSYAKKASRDATIMRKIGADFENRADRARSPGMKDSNTQLSSKYKQTSWKRRDGVEKAIDRLTKEDIGAMQSVVGENKGKKSVRVDTLKGPTLSNDPEVKIANAHFSGKSATLKAEGKGTDTAVPFVTDSVSPTQREINKSVKPTFKKIKEMLGKTGTSE